MERRFLSVRSAPVRLQKRAEGQTPTIEGYGSVFYDAADPGSEYVFQGWAGEYRERIMPGCFDRALREDDVRGLFNHDANMLLGRTAAGTMRLSVDRKGLLYSIDPPNTQVGRDVMESIDRGDLTGSSFAFIPREIRWTEMSDDDGDTVLIREIMDVQLFDVGPVVYPAYESSTTGIRAAGDLEEARRSWEEWKARSKPTEPLYPRLAQYRARAVEVSA